MFRIFDVFSHFNIETLSRHEMSMLARRDRESIPLTKDVLSPSKLIELGKQDQIQHTIKKTRLRRGSMFYQFSLSDYFKVMRLATGGEVDEGDRAYVPVRRFDERALVLASGSSLVGRLMESADRVIVEDVDLTARHLRRHINEFGLSNLRVREMSNRRRMRGAFLSLISRRS